MLIHSYTAESCALKITPFLFTKSQESEVGQKHDLHKKNLQNLDNKAALDTRIQEPATRSNLVLLFKYTGSAENRCGSQTVLKTHYETGAIKRLMHRNMLPKKVTHH